MHALRHLWLISLFCLSAAQPTRRLNRTEYNYAVQDLLGIHYQPAADFPHDDSGYGFDNIGDVLSLSTVLMEHYMKAAEKAAHEAVYGPTPMRPTVVRYRAVARPQPLEPTPLMTADATGLSQPNTPSSPP